MNDKIKKVDKRIVVIYVVVILLIIIGIAFALKEASYAFNTDTGVYGIDETAYGDTHFNSDNLDLKPILDSDITTKTNNVIKIDFTVGGAQNNPTDRNIIYDIALNDLDIDCDLLSPYMKWKLLKNGVELSSGNLSNSFDTIVDNRLVLTDTQLDLPTYSSSKTGYDNYTFYLWLSDSCQSSDTSECFNSEDQSSLLGKSLSGKIEVELNTGVKKPNNKHPSEGDACSNIQDDIINLYNDGSTINTVNIGGNSSNPQVKLNATQGIMLDNNGDYRYYGANPNNYVTFNGETWRIIGVFNNVDDGTGKKETRLKIIRNESIGSYSYDSSASDVNSGYGVNNWSKADLNTELNSLYYNSTSGTCYTNQTNTSKTCNFTSTGLGSDARSMIDDAVYYLGGSSIYEGLYPNDYYEFERGTNVYNCSDTSCGGERATTWTGKIGLMYPSDYVYATDLSLCIKDGYNYDNTTCKSNDWLFDGVAQWTITPEISNEYNTYNIRASGYVHSYASYFSCGARPVGYLKSSIAIESGDGTSSNPYQLKLT